MITIDLFFLLSLFVGANSIPAIKNSADILGCVKCHPIEEDKINVHLIPHSHDDVGWLKTVEEYYYGLNSTIQRAGVQYIITSVVDALQANPDRRFIQVETFFFWKWWQNQDDTLRAKFKELVDNGQIEIVNGAWSMNDEACSNYQSTIDQFTWGLRVIKDTIGKCGIPRVGWQIDPFGHSREQASLLAQMGYHSMFFARLDHDDKTQRQKKGIMDFAWQGSANLDESIIFGSAFPTDLYNPPDGYCWDQECNDDSVVDDAGSVNYNLDTIVNQFVAIIKNYTRYYPTKNIIIPMGGDFQYEAASINFINMDKFIRGFENHTTLNVFYSTPSCYVKAVHDDKPTLTLKTDDFFPYSNDNHSFWAGYYTSRPNSKRFERMGHNILQGMKQLFALSSFNSSFIDNQLEYLRNAMGVMQHHDAITGTEKQHVANDYVRLLTKGIDKAETHFGEITKQLLNASSLDLTLSSCLLANVSICDVSQNADRFLVVVYNPLAWEVTHYIRLPAENASFTINGPDGRETHDLVPTMSSFDFVKIKNAKPATFELVFAARNVPPLGMKLYHISKNTSSFSEPSASSIEGTSFEIDPDTNLLKSVTTMGGKLLNISQTFHYYTSETGNSDASYIPSGAYLFRPNKNYSAIVSSNVTRPFLFSHRCSFYGKIVDEVYQRWISDKMDIVQTIRCYKQENYIELDWMVGNIDIDKEKTGKEVISKFTLPSTFENDNTFYTDSNGRETIKRTRNARPDYTYNATIEPVAGNYYPITSKIAMEDDIVRIAVLTDRSQGGSSLSNNQLELMVHRRLLKDDNKGVGEQLNETEFGQGVYVRGTHYLVVGNKNGTNLNGKTTAAVERIVAQKKLVQPLVGLSATSLGFENIQNISSLSYSALTGALPENINILTFEPWSDERYILRLENIMEKGEYPSSSENYTIEDIRKIFEHFDLEQVQETTLAANMLLTDYEKQEKYSWQLRNATTTPKSRYPLKGSDYSVDLKPMEIRTYIVKSVAKPEPKPSPDPSPDDPDDGINFASLLKPVWFFLCILSVLPLLT